MSDFVSAVGSQMLAFWSKSRVEQKLEFRFNAVTEQRIIDGMATPNWEVGLSTRMVKFLGMPVLVNEGVPSGEIHIADEHGKLLGKITGLNDV